MSLRFNPAFVSHSVAFAKAIKELGHEAGFVFNPAYRRFPDFEKVAPVFDPADSPTAAPWTHAVFQNPSTENRAIASVLKQAGTKILYVYHEPWQQLPSYLRGEGLSGTLKAILAHHTSVSVLKLADMVMLASQYGLSEYGKSDARFNGNSAYLPLLFDDEAPSNVLSLLGEKRYFGYIGNLCRSHGFDQFVTFMRDTLRDDGDIRFLIASRIALPGHILKDPILGRNLDKIEIRCGRPLENEEINRCYMKCFCVWNIYRRSTQSGVLPKAFMFGTPVVASRIGSFPEWVCEGVNGRFAEANDSQGILNALVDMRERIGSYAKHCRETFLNKFFYRAHLGAIRQLLD